MTRRDFFLMLAMAAGGMIWPRKLVRPKQKRARMLDLERGGWPDKGDMKWYVSALPEQHGNWPIVPPNYTTVQPYTITWHNTGINQWPTQC
jgi:hypothetical protein